MLKAIIDSVYLNLISGLVLLVTSGYETWNTFGEGTIGAHHGVLIFSIIHILKTLPEMVEGFKDVNEAEGLEKEK